MEILLRQYRNHREIIYASLDRGVVAIYGFVYLVYFARVLSKIEYGLFTLIYGICILSLTLCDLAVGQALIYYGAGRTKEEFLKVAAQAFILKLLIFSSSSLLIFLSAPLISHLFKNENLGPLVRLLPLLIFVILLYDVPIHMLQAKESYNRIFFIDFSLLLISLAGIWASHEFGFLKSAKGAMLFLIITRLLSFLLGYLILARSFGKLDFSFNLQQIKNLFSYSKLSFANSLGALLFTKIDIFMLGFMLNPTYVALYASASVIINLFKVLNEPINMVVFPTVSRLNFENELNLKEKIARIYKKSSVLAFSFCLPPFLILSFWPREIMFLLYGEKYLESFGLIRLFAIWGLILPFYRSAASIFNGLGRPELNAKFSWLGSFLNVLLNLGLIYYLKTIGAVVASVLTNLFLLVLYLNQLQRSFNIIACPTFLMGFIRREGMSRKRNP